MVKIFVPKNEKSSLVLPHSVASLAGFGSSLREHSSIELGSGQYSEVSELSVNFFSKKVSSSFLGDSYFRLGWLAKSNRVVDCGSFLSFAHEIDSDGLVADKGKLHQVNFCRDRLCPMCSWRRSLKMFGQVSQIMDLIGDKYIFLFVTLTVPNVSSDCLSDSVTELMKAWRRFVSYKPIKRILKGYFRALEITRNPVRGDYHPHFHSVFAVPLSYLKSRDYLKRDDFLRLWQKACRDESITQVDIRVAKDKYGADEFKSQSNLSSAVAEIAKYAVKSSDYIIAGNEVLTDEIVHTLSTALFHRRLTAFGGCFKDAFISLGLDDVDSDNVDLTHINDDINPTLALLIVRYGWSSGAYKMIDSYVKDSK